VTSAVVVLVAAIAFAATPWQPTPTPVPPGMPTATVSLTPTATGTPASAQAATVHGIVLCKVNFKKRTMVCTSQPTPLRTQRAGYDPDTLSPADAVGVARQMVRFGPTYFVDPTYRDAPNAAQSF